MAGSLSSAITDNLNVTEEPVRLLTSAEGLECLSGRVALAASLACEDFSAACALLLSELSSHSTQVKQLLAQSQRRRSLWLDKQWEEGDAVQKLLLGFARLCESRANPCIVMDIERTVDKLCDDGFFPRQSLLTATPLLPLDALTAFPSALAGTRVQEGICVDKCVIGGPSATVCAPSAVNTLRITLLDNTGSGVVRGVGAEDVSFALLAPDTRDRLDEGTSINVTGNTVEVSFRVAGDARVKCKEANLSVSVFGFQLPLHTVKIGTPIHGVEKAILNLGTNSSNVGLLISEDESSFTVSTPHFGGNTASLAMYALPGAGFVRYRSKSTEYAEAEKATRGPNGHVIFAHRRGVKDPATRNPACAVELDSRDKLVRMFSCSECEGGLAVACNGRAVAVVVVSVTSSHRYRIALFDYATGVETTSVCNYGDIGAAHGLRFHPDGARLFVADSFNHRVTVFAVNGAGLLAQIDVSEPWAVDFATTGDVLIAARGDNCVLVMSPDLSTELRRVKGTTELSCLNDIAIGPVSGLLYALDNTNGRVVVFE